VGCTTGSRGEEPGKMKPVMGDDNDDDDDKYNIIRKSNVTVWWLANFVSHLGDSKFETRSPDRPH